MILPSFNLSAKLLNEEGNGVGFCAEAQHETKHGAGAGFAHLAIALHNPIRAVGFALCYEADAVFNSISDDAAIRFIHGIARNQKTGEEAETDYVRVELYETAEGGAYPARKFRVAIEVTGITGAGTEIMKVAGNLHQVGSFVEGTFNPETKTFTAAE